MSEWVPFLQSLVWPVFLAIFLYLIRARVAAILRSFSARIERGDPFQAGPSGISFGHSEQKLTRLEEAKADNEIPENTAITGKGELLEVGSEPTQYEEVTYLVHGVSAPRIDTDNIERRTVKVMVDADSDDLLDEIERVVYHLHPTFPLSDREITDRKRRFVLSVRAWGEFNLSADVYFKGYGRPLTLFRYLNFSAGGSPSSGSD